MGEITMNHREDGEFGDGATILSRQDKSEITEERQVFEDRDWWREAGNVLGLTLNGWTFRNEARFTSQEGTTVYLPGPVAERLIALTRRSSAGVVKVKPMEWAEWGRGGAIARMNDPLEYTVEKGEKHTRLYLDRGRLYLGAFDTVDEAKAAAQADLNQRILSALSPQEPVTGEAVASLEVAGWTDKLLAELASKDPWDYGDQMRVRGLLMSFKDILSAALRAAPSPLPAAVGETSDRLPCPFCGGPAKEPIHYNGTMETGCAGPHECPGTDVLVPLALWNRRALASPSTGVDDAMVERAARAACRDNVNRIHAAADSRGFSRSLSGSEYYAYPPSGWPDFNASMRAALLSAHGEK